MPIRLASRKNFDRPSPPPLPASDQAEFETLLKANQTIGASPAITSPAEELQHRDLRRGPKKDFEGDVNPRTGERGGPKVDPFKAGDGDWQYGGRVT
ncbi:MAG: putative mitochondrial protein, conserved [Tremellales sp. Tagirdzhanova-0007]|nr:MAG: putative mitochondrial protein, conserved [Tremellales sp. Tagirdzhanova-0007]